MTKGLIKFLFATALVFTQAIAVHIVQAGEYRQHEAHEHGVAHLNVAVEGNDLTIEVDSLRKDGEEQPAAPPIIRGLA